MNKISSKDQSIIRLCCVYLLGLFGSALPVQAHNKSPKETNILQCGIQSLYCCLKYHHVHASIETLYEQIRPDTDGETSLFQLATCAGKYGLWYRGYKNWTPEHIKSFLNEHSSIIVQYEYNAHGVSYGHIACLFKTKTGLIMLDYPKVYQVNDAMLYDLSKKSKGMIVLSSEQIKHPYSMSQILIILLTVFIMGAVLVSTYRLCLKKRDGNENA